MGFILQHKRPERPTHSAFSEDLWLLMQRCWGHEKDLRPPASEVLGTLEGLACKRLASQDLTEPQRIRLINAIFSDHNWSKVINHVHTDYAQGFLNVAEQVSHRSIPHLAGQLKLEFLSGARDSGTGDPQEMSVHVI